MAHSHWPTTAQPRSWPHFKRVHPILATHPPTATRFQSRLPDYGQATRPAAHSRTRLQQPRLASRVTTVCTVFCSRRGILSVRQNFYPQGWLTADHECNHRVVTSRTTLTSPARYDTEPRRVHPNARSIEHARSALGLTSRNGCDVRLNL